MEVAIKHITQYVRPTNADRVPFGTRWTYQHEDDTQEHYIQISTDQNVPHWIRLGMLLECVLEPKYENEKFLHKLIKDYKDKQPGSRPSPL